MFSKNSLPKIVILSDRDDVQCTFKNDCDDWFSHKFDVVILHTSEEVFNLLIEHRDEVFALITQNADGWQQAYPELALLPDYIKRRWYDFNDYDDHGNYVYMSMSHEQLCNSYIAPKFSFVTPLYNTKPEYFAVLYRSLCQQTINDWEWVLLDDSPEPLEWVKDYVSTDMRLRYFRISPTNGNIGLAKWRANCMSTGRWLFELDHDDFLPYWCLKILSEAMEENPNCGFFYSDTLDIDGNGNNIEKMYGDEFAYGFCHPYDCEDPDGNILHVNDTAEINSATIRHIVGVPNHLRCWRRDIYFKIGGHSQWLRIADDYELLVRTFLETTFCHIKYPCYFQRFDGGNSQDADGGVNRADIQRRVWSIANSYNECIHERMLELVGEENWDPNSADVTMTLNLPNTNPVHVNKIYVPWWVK